MRQYGLKCKKCGDEIYTNHRHDFRGCSCKSIAIDGGFELYQRWIGTEYTRVSRDLIPEGSRVLVTTNSPKLDEEFEATLITPIVEQCSLLLELDDGKFVRTSFVSRVSGYSESTKTLALRTKNSIYHLKLLEDKNEKDPV